MRLPFESMPGQAHLAGGVFAAVFLVVGARQMAAPGRTMKQLGCDIVGFELAGTQARLASILNRWGPRGKAAARRSLQVDSLLFIPGYAVLLAVIAAGSADEVGRRVGSLLGDLTRVAAYLALAAGAFDYLENASLTMVLKGRLGFGLVARGAAITKFGLVIPAVAWLVLLALPVVAAPTL